MFVLVIKPLIVILKRGNVGLFVLVIKPLIVILKQAR